jgi:hypothetical protein
MHNFSSDAAKPLVGLQTLEATLITPAPFFSIGIKLRRLTRLGRLITIYIQYSVLKPDTTV